jgi:hypothetical protein
LYFQIDEIKTERDAERKERKDAPNANKKLKTKIAG